MQDYLPKSNIPSTNCPLDSPFPSADLPPLMVYTGTFRQYNQPFKKDQQRASRERGKVLTHANVSALLLSV